MLENTAAAQARVDTMRGDHRVKVVVSFPDPLYPEKEFNSLIVAPSFYFPDLLAFIVDRVDAGATLLGRQTAINVAQAKRLIDVLEAWIAEQSQRNSANEG